jgi:WD40 repeat protein
MPLLPAGTNRFGVLAALACLLLLTACTPAGVSEPASVPTETASPVTITVFNTATASATATRTPGPTRTTQPTLTHTTSPQPTQTIAPAPVLEPDFVLENFRGEWSPAGNELAGVIRTNGDGAGLLALASAPDFEVRLVDNKKGVTTFIWSPDGNFIFYGVPDEGLWENESTALWVFDNNQAHAYATPFNQLRWLDFWGWMDSFTLVFNSYTGANLWEVKEWNYRTDQVLAKDLVHLLRQGDLNAIYAPWISCLSSCELYVIARDYSSHNRDFGVGIHSILFPDNNGYTRIGLDSFQDWLPGTNQMLIKGYHLEDMAKSVLLEWNLETGEIQSIVPAIHGRYSPDGSLMIWVSHQQVQSFTPGSLESNGFDTTATDAQTFLHIFDTKSKVFIISTPLSTDLRYSLQGYIEPQYTLSPDQKWIVLVTPGEVELDEQNLAFQLSDAAGNSSRYLSVFNLEAGELTNIIKLGDLEYSKVIWSPNNDRFVYLDMDDHWYLFDLPTGEITSLRGPMGEPLSSPSWSHDGSYLSLYYSTTNHTYIFDLAPVE